MSRQPSLRAQLLALANPSIAAHSQRFFKTAPGEYGAGDRFLGVRVPTLRRLARAGHDVAQRELLELLRSDYHEERLLALLVLVERFRHGDDRARAAVYSCYLANLRYVNNWDLVDSSAPYIVGAYLENRSRKPLLKLARSQSLWSRRIAVLATLHFIRLRQFSDTLAIAELLMRDEEDLIHKAVGWMLREVGNRDRDAAEQFLRERYRVMPRTMLRYAIERYPAMRRRAYLAGNVK